MTHEQMDELYDLYVLGVLEPDAAAEISGHVRDGCEYCLHSIGEAAGLDLALIALAQPVKPAPSLRRRVLASIATEKPHRKWNPVPALVAACLALAILAVWESVGWAHSNARLRAISAERSELQAALLVLSRSDTRAVSFGGQVSAPRGRVFVNPSGGVVFVGFELPQLNANRTFELWVVPNAGAPRAAGLFRVNPAGESVAVSRLNMPLAAAKAIAVSIEPRTGSAAPTTTPIVVVPLS